jgi:hypothetical protein
MEERRPGIPINKQKYTCDTNMHKHATCAIDANKKELGAPSLRPHCTKLYFPGRTRTMNDESMTARFTLSVVN